MSRVLAALAALAALAFALPACAATGAAGSTAAKPQNAASAKKPASRSKKPPTAKAAPVAGAAVAATVTAATATAAKRAGAGAFANLPDAKDFIRGLIDRHGFDENALNAVFAAIRREPDVLRFIAPARPGFKRSWDAYRSRFLDPLRVRGGLAFWRENEAALERASSTYGMPPEIIVSIIGVETIYGRVTGEFRVVDALATLAFEYPRRAEFFRGELEQHLLLSRETGTDPFIARGSFAGATGLPQFMPGSIRRYAVDFDGDGRIDLRWSATDAIGSVARFLAEHGWVPGAPVVFDARIDDESRLGPLIEAGIEPRFLVTDLAEYGVGAVASTPPAVPLALIDLPNGDAPTSYVLGAPNFYVITRYNRSSFYAMAVIELARELRRLR